MSLKKNRMQMSSKRIRSLVIVLLGGVGVALAMQGLLSVLAPETNQTANEHREELRSEKSKLSFEGLSLEARAVYVFDLKNNTVLYAKNENEKLPLASVTKLMTAYLAREHMSESVVLTLTKDDLASEGDSGLRPGERWRLGDLLDAMLLISSNDAAHAVAFFVGVDGHPERSIDEISARAQFVTMMNKKAEQMKLEQMEFFNESGLDVNVVKNGGYGSAKNVATLFAELWTKYPETVEMSAHKDARIYSQDNIAHYLPNTNEIVGHIPGLIASKTGFTDIAGGNLAVIFDRGIGDPVVVVVLGSTYKGRFDDMVKIVAGVIAGGDPKAL